MKQQSIQQQPGENFFPVSRPGKTKKRYDKKKTAADNRQIDISDAYEIGYWSRKFGVSRERLAEAVQTVGTNAEDVAIELGKPW